MIIFKKDEKNFIEKATDILEEDFKKNGIVLLNSKIFNDTVLKIGRLYGEYLDSDEFIL